MLGGSVTSGNGAYAADDAEHRVQSCGPSLPVPGRARGGQGVGVRACMPSECECRATAPKDLSTSRTGNASKLTHTAH